MSLPERTRPRLSVSGPVITRSNRPPQVRSRNRGQSRISGQAVTIPGVSHTEASSTTNLPGQLVAASTLSTSPGVAGFLEGDRAMQDPEVLVLDLSTFALE